MDPKIKLLAFHFFLDRYSALRTCQAASHRRCRARKKCAQLALYRNWFAKAEFRSVFILLLSRMNCARLKRVNRASRKWREANPEQMAGCQARWAIANKSRIVLKQRERYKELELSDPSFLLQNRLRSHLNKFVRSAKNGLRTVEFIGCTIAHLKQHLERQFQEGMAWDNYGIGGWEIDHILPVASFDLSKADQIKQCWHWTNLRPLWRLQNRTKGQKIGYEFGNLKPALVL